MNPANPLIGIRIALVGAPSRAAGWRSVLADGLAGGARPGFHGVRRAMHRCLSKGGLPT